MTRKITSEEKKLWKLAVKGVSAKGAKVGVEDFIAAAPVKITSLADMLPPPKAKDKRALKELVAGKVNAMDGSSFWRLRKGKVKIDARLDLHGMWLSEAKIAVRDFIEAASRSGKRCLLIITGKGGLRGDGKIRAEFPKWINDPDIRRLVLSFTQAAAEHGGDGAFYIYLRK
jgi:DNA-nicking Smr family endonuclease